MTENPLERIRRSVRDAEERLKKQAGTPEADASRGRADLRRSPVHPFVRWERLRGSNRNGDAGEVIRMMQRSLGTIIQASRDSFIRVNSPGNWELVNGNLPEWLGYTPEEFSDVSPSDIFEPVELETLLDEFPAWFTGEDPIVRRPVRLRNRTGGFVPVAVSTCAWPDESGNLVAYILLADERPRSGEFRQSPQPATSTAGSGVDRREP